MRAFFFTDLKGDQKTLEKLRTWIYNEKPDFVVSCGDLVCKANYEQTAAILINLKGACANFFTLFGNEDGSQAINTMADGRFLIHNQRTWMNKWAFAGYSHISETSDHGAAEAPEDQIGTQLLSLVDRSVDLFSYGPAFGINDHSSRSGIHTGSQAMLEVLHRRQPLLVVHGHTEDQLKASVYDYQKKQIVSSAGIQPGAPVFEHIWQDDDGLLVSLGSVRDGFVTEISSSPDRVPHVVKTYSIFDQLNRGTPHV